MGDALSALAPIGSGQLAGAQIIRIGDTPAPRGLRAAAISGSDPFALAAAIDRFVSAAVGKPSTDVMVASAENLRYPLYATSFHAK